MSLPDKITVQLMFGEKGRRIGQVVDKEDSLRDIEASQRDIILENLSHSPDKVFITLSDSYRGHYKRQGPSEGLCIPNNSMITYEYVKISEQEYNQLH